MAAIQRALRNIASGTAPSFKKRTPTTVFVAEPSEQPEASPFSFPRQYPAHLTLHIILLLASFVLLPRSIKLQPAPGQLRNLDRPQHPFLVPLTGRPEVTTAWTALGSAFVVGWWAGSIREWVREGKMGVGIAERLRDENYRTDIWNAAAFTFYTSLAYFLGVILFGAPLSTHLLHSYFLALNLAILTAFVPSYALGTPSFGVNLPLISSRHSRHDVGSIIVLNNTWVRLFAERKPKTPVERAITYPALGALSGAWIGVIPIGLDWDRPWQAYPLTPLFGATVGYALGALFALGLSIVYYLAALDMADTAASEPAPSQKAQGVKKKAKKSKKE